MVKRSIEKINFTDQEINDTKKTLEIVIDDLKSLYQISMFEDITIVFDMLEKEEKWCLLINEKEIVIYRCRIVFDSWLYERSSSLYEIPLEYKKTKKEFLKKEVIETKRNPLNDRDSQYYVFHFLSEYESIREEILKRITKTQQEKEKRSKALETLRAKYSNDVYVDFGPSQTLNVQTIEVVEDENGQKVGTINFGSKIINIITDGDIFLIKRKKAKQKIK